MNTPWLHDWIPGLCAPQAIRGLSETARIERWDGSSWTAVQNVDLEKTGNDDLVRSTKLPRLRRESIGSFARGPRCHTLAASGFRPRPRTATPDKTSKR